MSKFKVGDKVRRTKDEFYGMTPGDIGTVKEDTTGSLTLDEFGGRHSNNCFELVETFKQEYKVEFTDDLKVGDTVEVIKGGYGVASEHIGSMTTITEVGGDYCKGPGVKTKKFKNIGFDGWIGKDTFKLIENKTEETKMEKPETKLEKDALVEAKKEVVKAEIERRAVEYKTATENFISLEKSARDYRKRADELAEKLNITEAEKKQLF